LVKSIIAKPIKQWRPISHSVLRGVVRSAMRGASRFAERIAPCAAFCAQRRRIVLLLARHFQDIVRGAARIELRFSERRARHAGCF
jgi:hypothetical protein